MADLEQALQEEMGMCGRWTGFGVSRPVARPRTGDEGGPTPYSEYSLHFKTTLVPRWDGRGQAVDGSGFGHRGLVTVTGFIRRIPTRLPSPASYLCSRFRFSRFSLIFALDDGCCSGWNIGLASISNDGWVPPLIPEGLIKACNITQDYQKQGMRV